MTDDLDAIVSELVPTGLVTVGEDAEGAEAWTLTPNDEQVTNQIAMSSEDDGVALMTAVLDVHTQD